MKDSLPLDVQSYIEEGLGCLWIIGGVLIFPLVDWMGIIMIFKGITDHASSVWCAIKHVKRS
jgi:hypothetical protein